MALVAADLAEGAQQQGGSLRPVVVAAFPDEGGWRDSGSDDAWVRVDHPDAVVPSQGWKLHVSATVDSAVGVLGRILPVLLSEPCCFKVAASVDRLAELNRGEGGSSQVGKFVTVYTADDAHAVRLARALEAATALLRGPRVPSDRTLRSSGLVHYRYGAFSRRLMQTALGEVLDAIEAPTGGLEPDRRGRSYQAPSWVADPFVAAGLVTRPAPVDLLVADRYLTAAILSSSLHVTVRLVVDLEGGQRRVLKEAHRDDDGDGECGPWDGAQGRLRHEAAVLAELADDPRTPTVHDVFERGDSLFVVMEHLPGLTLEQRVNAETVGGRFIALSRVAAWATALADILGALHDRGMVYGDLKSPNVLIGPNDELFLVDFESVYPTRGFGQEALLGTAGYASPQRLSRHEPTVGDDVYALGAMLLFMLTGAEPALAPNRCRLLDRPVALLNPSVPSGLVDLVARCLDPDPAGRPTSMAEFRRSLDAALRSHPPARAPVAPVDGGLIELLARRVAAEPIGDDAMRDVDDGVAGVVLALAQAAPELDRPEVWDALAVRARWLVSSTPLPGGPLPGLYVGEAGVGAAFLRAGQALGDDALVELAITKGRQVSCMPHRSPDLFNGSAGRLRFHLLLWHATGEGEHLDAAVTAGAHLVATAERPEPDQAEWRIPSGYDGASGICYLGYAHGVAGIADALLDLYEATADATFFEVAAAGGRRLHAQAVPVLHDGSGLDWPEAAGGRRTGALWCHGGAGVTRFLAHAARLDLLPDSLATCRAGARFTAAARTGAAGQCHGLAGNADVLVDVYRATGGRVHLRGAEELGRLMTSYLEPDDVVVPRSPRQVRGGDLMNGWAGLLSCALRLRAPDRVPHVLAPPEAAGRRWRATRSSSARRG